MSRLVRRAALLPALAAALAAGGVLSLAVAPPAAVAADEIDGLIAEMKALEKAGEKEEAKLIGKITESELKNDARLTNYIASLARNGKTDKIAKAAIVFVSKKKDDAFLKWLVNKAGDDKYLERHKERYFAVMDALGRYDGEKLKDAKGDLEDVIKTNLPKDGGIASRAITAYGRIREKSVVDQLLKWLQETEKTTAGGQSGKQMGQAQKDSYATCKAAIVKALKEMTRLEIADFASWDKFWEENRKTYEFPDPNQGEPDYPTLKEYKDPVYRFVVTKPDAPFWAFKKSDLPSGGLINLECVDDKGMPWVRIRIATFPQNTSYPNCDAFVKGYEKRWRGSEGVEPEFEQFSKEPAVEEKKWGKAEFHILTCRGLGKGSWKNWDSHERRVYVTQPLPATFVYFEIAMRNAAEDAIKAQLQGVMDGMVWK